jgi:hypothetical protein
MLTLDQRSRSRPAPAHCIEAVPRLKFFALGDFQAMVRTIELPRISLPLDSAGIPWAAPDGGAGHEEAPQPGEVTGLFGLRGWDLNPRPSGYEIARNSARSRETERKANSLDLQRFHKPTFRVLQPLRWPLNPSGRS